MINQRLSCTAFELSVGDILSVLWLMGDFNYPEQLTDFAQTHQADLLSQSRRVLVFNKPTDFIMLSAEESEAVLALFFEVNTAFFKGNANEEDEQWGGRLFPVEPEKITGSAFYSRLCDNVATMTRFGHANVLTYPFSYFLITLNNFNEAHRGK